MISQKEYLKKYLSSDKDKKKIKKKKPKIGSKTVKIIDDDIDLKNMRAIEDGEFDIYNNTEDGPQIAGIVDERGPVDFSDKKRWKIITDDIDGDITVTSIDRNERISEAMSQSSRIPAPNSRNRSPSDDGKGSPPHRQRNDSDQKESSRKTLSSKKLRQHSVSSLIEKPPASEDSDFSPPRRVKKNNDLEKLTRRRKSFKKKQSRAVSSPARNSSDSENNDTSPPSRTRKDSDSDETRCKKSSKKKRRVENPCNSEDSKCSQPRIFRKNSDLDESICRKSFKKRHSAFSLNFEDNDLRLPRRIRKDSDSDLSPPRNSKAERIDCTKHSKQRENSLTSSRHDKHYNRTSKASPSVHFESLRSRGKDEYKSGKHSNRSNSSEHERSNRQSRKDRTKLNSRRRKEGDKVRSISPQDRRRDGKKGGTNKHSRKDEDDSAPDLSPPRETRMNHEDLDSESKPLQKTSKNYQEMSEETTGFGQAPIFRDRKTGRRRDFAAERRDKEQKDEKRKELEDKYAQWGRGLKQVEDHKEKLDRDLYEMSKPLARYADDADLERELKAQEREGDPMLAYIKRKQIKEGKQEPEKPKYQGPFMPNRFGIQPGYRWDGVDRSNGYEKKWFDAQNARKAVQEEAYKWSTADM
ncbi:BUD13 homolog [Neodiprion pinetum]|uniref:BUD13 homolog n=1 Tax=Neodiprion pinetum TaxID=441929 RepID=UPI001EDD0825|nr:BUD13 homolog [Neodiprion pinetum]